MRLTLLSRAFSRNLEWLGARSVPSWRVDAREDSISGRRGQAITHLLIDPIVRVPVACGACLQGKGVVNLCLATTKSLTLSRALIQAGTENGLLRDLAPKEQEMPIDAPLSTETLPEP